MQALSILLLCSGWLRDVYPQDGPPYITDVQKKGENVTLTCPETRQDEELLSILWSKDGVTLVLNTDRDVHKYNDTTVHANMSEGRNNSLVLTELNLENTGNYTCSLLIKNTTGQEANYSSTVEVIVQDVPSPPGEAQTVDIQSQEVTLGWTSSTNDNNSPIFNYTVQISKCGEEGNNTEVVVDGSTLNTTITGLQPSTCYFAKVWATNNIGQSHPGPQSEELWTQFGGEVTTNCPRYIMENRDETCQCRAKNITGHRNFTWVDHSQNKTLSLRNVQRQNNGTQYTCRVTADGSPAGEVNYTVRVAYGPFNKHVHVAPSHLVTNGSQTFNLTCNATDVYPSPRYRWAGITCENPQHQRFCTFAPKPATDDQRNVTCKVTSSIGKAQRRHASKQIQLNLSYPPIGKPVIQPQPTGRDLLHLGDNLTCTMTGGKPLVDSVHFYCLNPYLQDQDDKVTATSVSSLVTVNSPQDSNEVGMTCFCKANWAIRPDYYLHISASVFHIQPDDDWFTSQWKMMCGAAIAVTVLIAFVFVGRICWKRRQTVSPTQSLEDGRDRRSGLYAEVRDSQIPLTEHRQGRPLPQLPQPETLPTAESTDPHQRTLSIKKTDDVSLSVSARPLGSKTDDCNSSDKEEDFDELFQRKQLTSDQDPTYSHTSITAL